MAATCAFGGSKGRRCYLSNGLEAAEKNIPAIITACGVLHSAGESHAESLNNGQEAEIQRLAWQSMQPARRSVENVTTPGNIVRDPIHILGLLPEHVPLLARDRGVGINTLRALGYCVRVVEVECSLGTFVKPMTYFSFI